MNGILSDRYPREKPGEQQQAIHVLTACLFGAGLLFAAFSGWVMTDKMADRVLLRELVQETANVRGELKSATDQLVSVNGKLKGDR